MGKRLTDTGVQGLRAEDRRVEVRDSIAPRLYVRVEPRTQRKRFVVRYRTGGRQRVVTLGSFSRDFGVADARVAAGEVDRQLRGGTDLAIERQRQRQARQAVPSVREFMRDEFIELYAKRHKKSWKQDEQALERWVIPRLGDLKVSDVTRRDVVAVLDEVRSKGRKGRGSTRMPSKVHGVLSRAFGYAIERGLIEHSPVDRVRERRTFKERRALTDDEIRKLWSATDPNTPGGALAVALALRLALLTGQRPGEIAGMRAADLDLDTPGAQLWRLTGEARKAGGDHHVPLGTLAHNVLAVALARTADRGWVFTSAATRSPIRTDSGISKGMVRIFSDQPDRPTAHQIRHTVATRLAMLEFDEQTIAAVLGHVPRTLAGRVYTHHDPIERKRRALAAWETQLLEILRRRS